MNVSLSCVLFVFQYSISTEKDAILPELFLVDTPDPKANKHGCQVNGLNTFTKFFVGLKLRQNQSEEAMGPWTTQ